MCDPRVVVVIPNRNGLRHLQCCLPSLRESVEGGVRTLLIDDASTDESCSFVAANHPWVTILRQFKNRGFAACVNLGLRWALGDGAAYVAVLNSDVRVPAGFLEPVVAYLDRAPQVAVAGFQEVNEQGARGVILPERIEFVDVGTKLPGMLYVCRLHAIADVGFYDEAYFMYGEEVDLFDRLTRAGFAIVQSNVPVWHFVSGSRETAPIRIAWYSYRNFIRFALKTGGILDLARNAAVSLYYGLSRTRTPAGRTWLGQLLSRGRADHGSQTTRSAFHLRVRRFDLGNRLVNLVFWFAALAWNAIALPAIMTARRRDSKLIKLARARMLSETREQS